MVYLGNPVSAGKRRLRERQQISTIVGSTDPYRSLRHYGGE